MSRARMGCWAGGLLLLFVGGLAGAAVLPRLDALRCFLRFQGPIPADHAGGAPPVGCELLADPARYGVHRAWLRRGEGAGPHAGLLFVHGVTPQGIDDGRILRAIEAFQAGGFCVVAPEIPFLVDPTVRDEDERRLVTLLRALAAGRVEGVDPERLGVVGISVGAGFALKACASWIQGGGRGVSALLAIGAADDIRRPADAWYELEDPDPGGGSGLDWERRNAAAFARSYGARAALRQRLGDTADARRLRTWLAGATVPGDPPADLESEAARPFASWLRAGPRAWKEGREALLADAWDQLERFSPAAWDESLRALRGVGVYLLHGVSDPLVPVTEADALARRLRGRTLVSVLRSHLLGHTAVDAGGLAEQVEHLVFMQSFFDAVQR